MRREDHRYLKQIEMREEGGTPSVVGAIRAGLVMQLKEVGTTWAGLGGGGGGTPSVVGAIRAGLVMQLKEVGTTWGGLGRGHTIHCGCYQGGAGDAAQGGRYIWRWAWGKGGGGGNTKGGEGSHVKKYDNVTAFFFFILLFSCKNIQHGLAEYFIWQLLDAN